MSSRAGGRTQPLLPPCWLELTCSRCFMSHVTRTRRALSSSLVVNRCTKQTEWLCVCWCVSTAPQCCLFVVVLWLYLIDITTFLLLLLCFWFCIWPNCNFDIISVNCSATLCLKASMYLRRQRGEFIMTWVVCVVCVCVCVCVVCVCDCVSCCLFFQVSRNLFLNVLCVLKLFIVFDQYFTKLACSVFWHLFVILYLLYLHHAYYYYVGS